MARAQLKNKAPNSDLVLQHVIYAGKRSATGGGVCEIFYPLKDGELQNKLILKVGTFRRGGGGTVGLVYEIKASPTLTSFLPSSYRPTQTTWGQATDIAEWEIEHRMAIEKENTERFEKKHKGRALDTIRLSDLQNMYNRLYTPERQAMERVIINYLKEGVYK